MDRALGQRASFIGELWLDNEEMGAEYDNKWVLDVYGKENIPKLKELMIKIADKYDVPISIKLAREKPLLERFKHDGE